MKITSAFSQPLKIAAGHEPPATGAATVVAAAPGRQEGPPNPAVHAHSKVVAVSGLQVPPLRQGLLSQAVLAGGDTLVSD